MSKYAVFWNDASFDLEDQPLCLLFDAPDDTEAFGAGLRVFMENNGSCMYLGTKEFISEFDRLRIVRLSTVTDILAEDPRVHIMHDECVKATKARLALLLSQHEAELEVRERAQLAQLKKKYESQ